MSWRKRLEFTRDLHLKTLHQDLRQIRKDLVCSHCGHWHGQIWATASKMHLTIISRAEVQNGGNQVAVVPVCDWCAKNNSPALPWDKALIKAESCKKALRQKELKKYFPKGHVPRGIQKKYA